MKKEDLEKVMTLLTETQKCESKREAFLKGALFGLGFVDISEPNWSFIKKRIENGDDIIHWLDIEKGIMDMHKKVRQDNIELIESMLKSVEC